MSLYDDAIESMKKPLYSSGEEALEAFTAEYEALGAKHGMTGYEFWLQAENEVGIWSEDHNKIHRLHRMIDVCYRLIEKGKNNG
jgi:hypothetical protein